MTHAAEIIDINGKFVEIDNKLVNVIKELNNVGLKTRHCCEGDISVSKCRFDEINKIDVHKRAYISIEASAGVTFEFKENKLIIRWVLV